MNSNKIAKDSKETGVLLISHGSRLPESSKTITKITELFKKYTDFKVGIAFMELHEPNIPTAMNELVKDTNIERVIAVPVFLSHGMHTTRDIPQILGLSEEEDNKDHDKHEHKHDSNDHHHHHFEKVNFDGEIIYTDPLGADPLIVEIIKKRVDNALKNV